MNFTTTHDAEFALAFFARIKELCEIAPDNGIKLQAGLEVNQEQALCINLNTQFPNKEYRSVRVDYITHEPTTGSEHVSLITSYRDSNEVNVVQESTIMASSMEVFIATAQMTASNVFKMLTQPSKAVPKLQLVQ